MQFDETDRQLMAKVRRNRQKWQWLRWVVLVVASLGAITGLLLEYILADMAAHTDDIHFGFYLTGMASMFLSSAFAWTMIVGAVIGLWRNPTRDLLLRIAEKIEKSEG